MTAANLTLTKPALVFVTSDPTVPEHIELTYSWTPGDPFALQLIFSDGDDDGEGNTWNSSFELFFNASADPQSAAAPVLPAVPDSNGGAGPGGLHRLRRGHDPGDGRGGVPVITVICTYADGDTIITRFNGTLAEAQAYFVGKRFNIGSVEDNVQLCTGIELVADVDPEV
jgi:hypothetical protein